MFKELDIDVPNNFIFFMKKSRYITISIGGFDCMLYGFLRFSSLVENWVFQLCGGVVPL